MKSKKGFTLIELLAVIAILAILIVIAVPAVLNIFNDSKKSAFLTQAKSLWKTAEQECLADAITDATSTTTAYCTTTGTDGKPLDMSGGSIQYNVTFNTSGVCEIATFLVKDASYEINSANAGTDTSAWDIDDVVDAATTVTCN